MLGHGAKGPSGLYSFSPDLPPTVSEEKQKKTAVDEMRPLQSQNHKSGLSESFWTAPCALAALSCSYLTNPSSLSIATA